jgi:hypothetical protein
MFENWYFTFGSSEQFPFPNDYIVIRAKSYERALELFMERYPNVDGCMNFSFCYSEENFFERCYRHYKKPPALTIEEEQQDVFGKCVVKDGEIVELEREYFEQGYVFKDYNAFEDDPKAPCYVPELTDCYYTKNDFMAICNYQEDIARMVFEAVNWQCPETFIEEQFAEEELCFCENCKKIFESYMVDECPYCKEPKISSI